MERVPALGFIGRLLPWAKAGHAKSIVAAETEFEAVSARWKALEEERVQKLAQLQAAYTREREEFLAEVRQRNAEVDEFEAEYKAGDPEAVVAYCSMVLERSEYPDGFPQDFQLRYLPESKQLLVEYELPAKSIVPETSEYKFTKNKDSIDTRVRKASEIKDLYAGVITGVCLRTLHELFEADTGKHIELVLFNGFVNDVNKGTGRDVKAYVISIRADKATFNDLDLSRIDKKTCLKNLGARMSTRPEELQEIQPYSEFDLINKRSLG